MNDVMDEYFISVHEELAQLNKTLEDMEIQDIKNQEKTRKLKCWVVLGVWGSALIMGLFVDQMPTAGVYCVGYVGGVALGVLFSLRDQGVR